MRQWPKLFLFHSRKQKLCFLSFDDTDENEWPQTSVQSTDASGSGQSRFPLLQQIACEGGRMKAYAGIV